MSDTTTKLEPELPELLPCPFCGGPVELERATDTYEEIHGRREWWGVVCRNTTNLGGSCAIQTRPSASKEAAITRWNRRSPALSAIEADRNKRAVEAANWQPIETAPKDGTEVALLFASEEVILGRWKPRVRAACWCGDWSIPYHRTNPPIAWSPLPVAPAPDTSTPSTHPQDMSKSAGEIDTKDEWRELAIIAIGKLIAHGPMDVAIDLHEKAKVLAAQGRKA